MTEYLDSSERRELARLETVIESRVRSFLEVGEALRRIRDLRLYRADFPSFETYLRERWDLSTSHGHGLVAAAETARRLSAVADQNVASERQIRPLLALPPDKQIEAWREAISLAEQEGADAPTSRHVSYVVRQMSESDGSVEAAGLIEKAAHLCLRVLKLVDDPQIHRLLSRALAALEAARDAMKRE